MLSDIRNLAVLVGLKQSKKAVEENEVKTAYVACDAAPTITHTFVDLCKAHKVDVEWVDTMKELGHNAGIEIGASVVVVLKQQIV